MMNKKIAVMYLTFFIFSCNLVVTSYGLHMIRKVSILDNLLRT